MTAPDNVLVQSNFRTPLGALHNAYGHDEASYDLALAILADRVATLTALEQQFQGAGQVAKAVPLAPQQPAPQPAAPPASDWGAPVAPSFAQATTPSCAHGPRTARSGTGAKGPWRAYFCPLPSARKAEQCSPQFLNRGTPEWDAFSG